MTLEDGLFALLSQNDDLSGLQGVRVYPIALPETPTLPATTYQVVGGSSQQSFEKSGPQRVRMQFDHFALTAAAARQLRIATRSVLDRFTGPLPNGFVVTLCAFIQPIDHFDSDARQFRCAAEYYFTFNLQ